MDSASRSAESRITMLTLVMGLATFASADAACSIHYAVPSTLDADAVTTTPVTLVGVGFSSGGASANASCHVRGGLFGPPQYAVATFVQGTVLNDTAMRCDIPSYGNWSGGVSLDVSGGAGARDGALVLVLMLMLALVLVLSLTSLLQVIIDTKLNGNESWSSGTNASLRYRNMVDVDLAKRPFMSNESAMLLLEPHAEDIAAVYGAHTKVVQICASVAGVVPPVQDCSQHGVAGGARLVPLKLPVPASGDAELLIKVSLFPANLQLSVHKRRWLTAAVPAVGSFVQVDHTRKMMRVNGRPFLSVGFYMHSFTTYEIGHTTLEAGIADLEALARIGAGNHHMMYSMESLNDADLARVLKVCEDNGIMFDWNVVGHVVSILNTSAGQCCNHKTMVACKCGSSPHGWPAGACAKGAICDTSPAAREAKWAGLVASAERVRNSSSLLGYYVCDDCVDAEVCFAAAASPTPALPLPLLVLMMMLTILALSSTRQGLRSSTRSSSAGTQRTCFSAPTGQRRGAAGPGATRPTQDSALTCRRSKTTT